MASKKANGKENTLKGTPGSETAFVILPRYRAGEEYVVVKDRNTDGQVFQNKKKFPGGGKETGDCTLGHAAVRETKEETGLDIFPPTEKLLEVHKPSVWDGGADIIPSVHCDVFFESRPPIDVSFFMSEKNNESLLLVPGVEIEIVEWQKEEEILESIKRREYFPNHAAAFFWRNVRERFLQTQDSSILHSITRRMNLRWRVAESTLIFCFYSGCPLCQEAMSHKKNAARQDMLPDLFKPKDVLIISGAVKFVIFLSDSFFDYVYLEPVSTEKFDQSGR